MIGIILSLAIMQSSPHRATHPEDVRLIDVSPPEMVTVTGPIGEAPDPKDVAAAKLASTWSPAFFAGAKREMDGMFFDYPSARFRDVKTGVRNSHRVICGMANAKNRMGAYVGWRYLLVVESSAGFTVEMEEAPTYKIKHYCLGATAWFPSDQTARIAP